MFSRGIDSETLLIVAAVFGLVGAGWFLVLIVWTMRQGSRFRRIQTRLGLIEDADSSQRSHTLRLWHEGQEVTALIAEGGRLTAWQRLLHMPRDAGWNVTPQTLFLIALGLAVGTGLLVFALFNNSVAAIGGVVAVLLVFWIYLNQRITKRRAIFERQLIDALQLAARSLRAGHPLMGAFRLVADEMGEPVATVFREICQQQALGVDLATATRNVSMSSANPDLKLFAASICIQLRTGGNLAELMDRLSEVIRERVRLGRRVRVLTAQTQFSKRILLALPFFVFFVLQILNKDYMRPLYETPTGRWLLAGAGLALVLGAWTINRMARLE